MKYFNKLRTTKCFMTVPYDPEIYDERINLECLIIRGPSLTSKFGMSPSPYVMTMSLVESRFGLYFQAGI